MELVRLLKKTCHSEHHMKKWALTTQQICMTFVLLLLLCFTYVYTSVLCLFVYAVFTCGWMGIPILCPYSFPLT